MAGRDDNPSAATALAAPHDCECPVCECERAAKITALGAPNHNAVIVTPLRGLVLLGSAQRKDDAIKTNCVLLTPRDCRRLARALGAMADTAERLATPEGVN